MGSELRLTRVLTATAASLDTPLDMCSIWSLRQQSGGLTRTTRRLTCRVRYMGRQWAGMHI